MLESSLFLDKAAMPWKLVQGVATSLARAQLHSRPSHDVETGQGPVFMPRPHSHPGSWEVRRDWIWAAELPAHASSGGMLVKAMLKTWWVLQAREQGLTPGAYARLSGDPDAAAPSALDDLQEYLDYQRYFEEYDEDDEVCCPTSDLASAALSGKLASQQGLIAAWPACDFTVSMLAKYVVEGLLSLTCIQIPQSAQCSAMPCHAMLGHGVAATPRGPLTTDRAVLRRQLGMWSTALSGWSKHHDPTRLLQTLSLWPCQTTHLHAVQVEAHYFSAAAGHARITLGNRRWGENGYVASGRQRARPVQNNKPKGPTPSKVGGLWANLSKGWSFFTLLGHNWWLWCQALVRAYSKRGLHATGGDLESIGPQHGIAAEAVWLWGCLHAGGQLQHAHACLPAAAHASGAGWVPGICFRVLSCVGNWPCLTDIIICVSPSHNIINATCSSCITGSAPCEAAPAQLAGHASASTHTPRSAGSEGQRQARCC